MVGQMVFNRGGRAGVDGDMGWVAAIAALQIGAAQNAPHRGVVHYFLAILREDLLRRLQDEALTMGMQEP